MSDERLPITQDDPRCLVVEELDWPTRQRISIPPHGEAVISILIPARGRRCITCGRPT